MAAGVSGDRLAGFTTAFAGGVPVALVGFVLALLLIRVRRPQELRQVLPKAA